MAGQLILNSQALGENLRIEDAVEAYEAEEIEVEECEDAEAMGYSIKLRKSETL